MGTTAASSTRICSTRWAWANSSSAGISWRTGATASTLQRDRSSSAAVICCSRTLFDCISGIAEPFCDYGDEDCESPTAPWRVGRYCPRSQRGCGARRPDWRDRDVSDRGATKNRKAVGLARLITDPARAPIWTALRGARGGRRHRHRLATRRVPQHHPVWRQISSCAWSSDGQQHHQADHDTPPKVVQWGRGAGHDHEPRHAQGHRQERPRAQSVQNQHRADSRRQPSQWRAVTKHRPRGVAGARRVVRVASRHLRRATRRLAEQTVQDGRIVGPNSAGQP